MRSAREFGPPGGAVSVIDKDWDVVLDRFEELDPPRRNAERAPNASSVARTLRLLVDEWAWPVTPGAYLTELGTCCCGDRRCPEPGRHPLPDSSWLAASRDPVLTRSRWRATPQAAIVVPVGWAFDLLDVPLAGGREAVNRLEQLGLRLPPVIVADDERLLFLVAAADRDRRTDGSQIVPAVSAGGRETASPRGADAAGRRTSEPEASDASRRASGAVPADTAIWVGGAVPCVPDVVVRRGGVVVAPALGPGSPTGDRWLVPPAPVRHPLPRMEDVLGPILQACRDATALEMVARAARTARPGPVDVAPDPAFDTPPYRRPPTGRGVFPGP